MPFKIGDTVIYNFHPEWGKGVIKVYEGGFYAIEFEKPYGWLHSCAGHTKTNQGYWLGSESLKLAGPILSPKEAVCVKIKAIQERRKEFGYAY
jgi:GH24 family phage-related lysozyme (muramidase)